MSGQERTNELGVLLDSSHNVQLQDLRTVSLQNGNSQCMRCQSMVTRGLWDPHLFQGRRIRPIGTLGRLFALPSPSRRLRGGGVAGKMSVERSAKNPQKANRNCESPRPPMGMSFSGMTKKQSLLSGFVNCANLMDAIQSMQLSLEDQTSCLFVKIGRMTIYIIHMYIYIYTYRCLQIYTVKNRKCQDLLMKEILPGMCQAHPKGINYQPLDFLNHQAWH